MPRLFRYQFAKLNPHLDGRHQVAPIGDTDRDIIQLSFENGKWIQENLSKGKRMELLPPWELFPLRDRKSRVFDDLKDQY